ncbi:MAG: hypothetical protein ACXITV_05425 [Luteibaculaceae bacterium]
MAEPKKDKQDKKPDNPKKQEKDLVPSNKDKKADLQANSEKSQSKKEAKQTVNFKKAPDGKKFKKAPLKTQGNKKEHVKQLKENLVDLDSKKKSKHAESDKKDKKDKKDKPQEDKIVTQETLKKESQAEKKTDKANFKGEEAQKAVSKQESFNTKDSSKKSDKESKPAEVKKSSGKEDSQPSKPANKKLEKDNPLKLRPGLKGNKLFRLLMILIKKDKDFYLIISVFFLLAGIAYPYPQLAMWLGFAFAGYAAIANDSIQTIGTFIASNAEKKWWQLWLFIATIFVATVGFSWYYYGGDVSYQRLSSKGFETAPTEFVFLQIAAPLVLLILTRLRMPVSTTFLLLSVFSADSSGIMSVAKKSLFGYVIAFVVAISVWYLAAMAIKKFTSGPAKPYWRNIQWITSGTLWSVWVMQDAANIAIFLPRALEWYEFLAFAGYIFFGLGLLFYSKGGKIQEIVKEKAEISDIRGATLVDFIYALILIFFQKMSKVPMSTTWVFIGLLGGREIGMKLSAQFDNPGSIKRTLALVWKDLSYALIGLAVSILLAIAVNPQLQAEIKALFIFD